MIDNTEKKSNLSKPNSACIIGFFGLSTFKALSNLVSLSNFDNLPILVSLTKELSPLAFTLMTLSNGKMATKSIKNQPEMYFFPMVDLLLIITKSSSRNIVLKQTKISMQNKRSQILL